jgi:hypothetical protein
VALTEDQRRDLRAFVEGYPTEGRALIAEWPPGCVVRARPGVVLMVPAPGVEGTVVSYFESGDLGVAAPLAIPHPVHGWGNARPGEVAKAPVSPADLEFVRTGLVTAEDVLEETPCRD